MDKKTIAAFALTVASLGYTAKEVWDPQAAQATWPLGCCSASTGCSGALLCYPPSAYTDQRGICAPAPLVSYCDYTE